MTEIDRGSSRRAHFLWLGPLIAVFGFLSYYAFFAKWPIFRDTAWLNIAILLAAVTLSVKGMLAVWDRGAVRRVAGAASVLVSGAFTATLIAYCYALSYGLPAADNVVALGERLPAVALVSDTGETIDLANAGPSLVVVFYRGFW